MSILPEMETLRRLSAKAFGHKEPAGQLPAAGPDMKVWAFRTAPICTPPVSFPTSSLPPVVLQERPDLAPTRATKEEMGAGREAGLSKPAMKVATVNPFSSWLAPWAGGGA